YDSATVIVGDVDLGILEIYQLAAVLQNIIQWEEASTMRNLSHSDEASTCTPIIDHPPEVRKTIVSLSDCLKRGANRGSQRSPPICKVSRILRDLSESSFTPQMVSIGLIHRDDQNLKESESLKERYLYDLYTREKALEDCVREVFTLIPQIRESYAGVKKEYSHVELATMMIMDGCFILEFCFKHDEEKLYLPNKMENNRIAMDLLLLENQVPFFVLEALFDCIIEKDPP
ncbi:putative UPF0481 protein, partial [Tanacetum coccineum]